MSEIKHISFGENDKNLINKIEKFQKENGLRTFVEAVRQLCKRGLDGNVNVQIDLVKK